ncbi:hypothetical protein [Rhizobium favelukesii]|uniref:hypothetical protein n=1 Tax=Rhizobium favelukesii TaxID=348824 RepID=UPI00215E8AAC|nr:hypothetical protein [Rhizobium favelukesii]MCS0459557.1 hypothetical protein [Rhizobium favelukesii]
MKKLQDYMHFLTVTPELLLIWVRSWNDVIKELLFSGWSEQLFRTSSAIGVVLVLIYCWWLGIPPNRQKVQRSAILFVILLIIAGLTYWAVFHYEHKQVEIDDIRLWRDTYLYWASGALLLIFPLFVSSALIALAQGIRKQLPPS